MTTTSNLVTSGATATDSAVRTVPDGGIFRVDSWLASHGIETWKNAICIPPRLKIAHPGFSARPNLSRDTCWCRSAIMVGGIDLLVCNTQTLVSTQLALYRVEGNALVFLPPVLTNSAQWEGTTRPGPLPDFPRPPGDTYYISLAVSYWFEAQNDALVFVPWHNASPESSQIFSCEAQAEMIRDAWKVPFAPSFASEHANFIQAAKAAKEVCDNRGRYYLRNGRLERDPSSAPAPP